MPSPLGPRKACLRLRDWRDALGEGSDRLLGALQQVSIKRQSEEHSGGLSVWRRGAGAGH